MANKNYFSVWPEWEIVRPLGRGAYGTVYEAIRNDHNVTSHAAIKVISIPSSSSEVDSIRSEGIDMNATTTYFSKIVDEFVQEIQLMQTLKGIQNIVSVEDYKVVEKKGELGWYIFIRMELLTSFNSVIRDRKLTEKEVVKLGLDICTALEICGKRNIIHRDIKPENIFLNDFGDYKLGDFGIARKLESTTSGFSQKGTLNYMAPEVVHSRDYDARADICSLGLVLYRLLNDNRLPFLDTDEQVMNPNERVQALNRRLRGEPLKSPCNASPAMANLVLRACAFNPDDRFSTASEMKQALLALQNGTYRAVQINNSPITSNVDVTSEIKVVGKKKSMLPLILGLLVLVAVIIGSSIFLLPKILGNNEKNNNLVEVSSVDSSVASADDSTAISAIIGEAEIYVKAQEYDKALEVVQKGLETYPESKELQEKIEEYTALITEKEIDEIIANVDELVVNGDYEEAIKTIESSLETYASSEKLQKKLDELTIAMVSKTKEDALSEAKFLADKEDYQGAMIILKKVIDSLETPDPELQAAYDEYSAKNAESNLNSVVENGESDLVDRSNVNIPVGTGTITDAENNDDSGSAQAITLGDKIEGTIAPETDIDFYAFNLPVSGTINIDITSYSRYYTIVLYDDSGAELWCTDENEYNSTVGFREDTYKVSVEAGNYFVKVTGFKYGASYSSTGQYNIVTSFTSSGANETEPNNKVAEANKFNAGETINGLIGMNDAYDFYGFTIEHSGRIFLNITSYMKYYTMHVYDTAGTELWYVDEKEYNGTVGFREDSYYVDLEAGTYFLKVTGYRYSSSYASQGFYSVSTSFTASGANETEPNNKADDGTPISLNYAVNGLIGFNDRYDFYTLNLSDAVTANLDITSYMRYYTIDIYDEAGKTVWKVDEKEFNSTSGFRSDSYEVSLSAGIYYIRISGYKYGTSYGSTGNYTFTLASK